MILDLVTDPRGNQIFADDVRRLLAAVGYEKTLVFGSSGGAVIGLELAARQLEQVRALVAHEPPKFGPVEEATEDLHEIYRSHGIRASLRTFMVGAGFGEPSPDMLASMEANPDFDFFFVHYIVGLAKHEPDIAGVEGAALAASCRPLAPSRAGSPHISRAWASPKSWVLRRRSSLAATVAFEPLGRICSTAPGSSMTALAFRHAADRVSADAGRMDLSAGDLAKKGTTLPPTLVVVPATNASSHRFEPTADSDLHDRP